MEREKRAANVVEEIDKKLPRGKVKGGGKSS